MQRKLNTRPRRIGLKLSLLAASLAFSVLVAEGLVRLFSDEGTTLLVKDALVGQRYRAGYSGKRYVPEADRKIELRFNRLGYRGPDRPTDPEGVRRVAVLGDSFVAAIAVDERDTMVAQLQRMLNRDDPAHRWQTLNFGVSGAGTAQSLLAWRHFVSQFEPDLVILCFYNGNDLADNHSGLSSAHRPYFGLDEAGALVPEPFSAARAGLSRWLADHSHLYVWQKHKMRILRDRLRETVRVLPPGFYIFDTSPPDPVPEAWQVTGKLIGALAEEVEAAGAEFLLVSIPAHEQIMDRYWLEMARTAGDEIATFDPNHPERRLGEICREHGIRFLPLVDVFRAGCAGQQLHFLSEGHWNEAGNLLAAQAIHDFVVDSRR